MLDAVPTAQPVSIPVSDLETPCLLLDQAKLEANVARLKTRLDQMGVMLRPHLKTTKSLAAARVILGSEDGPVTVSTLKEAAYFASGGISDILYAVGIVPSKLDRVAAIRRETGAAITVILDSPEQAAGVVEWCSRGDEAIPFLIELDADGHRSGVPEGDDQRLRLIADTVAGTGAKLTGVMVHAGASYDENTENALVHAAEAERRTAVKAASVLCEKGVEKPLVSIGSTPTAHFAENLDGVTEVRAGVFTLFDLFQMNVGVCQMEDIGLSVVATVIGHQRDKGWTIVDAGWMAMSRDRGTATQGVDYGYGQVCDLTGDPYPGVILTGANQEHGIIAHRAPDAQVPELPIGAQVRILPNHACATGAQHDHYNVVDSRREPDRVTAIWPRINGW